MNRRAWPLLILLLGAGFLWGLYELFRARFEAGDVYPPYSSLRADPLGTMALFESLERFPRLAVRRDYSDLNRLPPEPGTVYLHLAASASDWLTLPEDLIREIEGFLVRGGRLVITLLPEDRAPRSPTREPQSAEPTGHAQPKIVSALERWGLRIGYRGLSTDDDGTSEPVEVTREADLPLPETIEWHSGLVFEDPTPAWQPVYVRGTNAVVMERKFSAGTLVMATDSYFLSNEALRKDRQPELLAWLVAKGRQVVFDEAHLGIVEHRGVSTLLKRYRLFGVVAAALVLALLFIWRSVLPFLPPYDAEEAGDILQGREASAGLVNLLRRNIPFQALLKTCFAEWQKTLGAGQAPSPARLDQANAILNAQEAAPARFQEPVSAYNEIARCLSRKRSGGAPKPQTHTLPAARGGTVL